MANTLGDFNPMAQWNRVAEELKQYSQDLRRLRI